MAAAAMVYLVTLILCVGGVIGGGGNFKGYTAGVASLALLTSGATLAIGRLL